MVKITGSPLQGMRARSLVRELISHTPQGAANKNSKRHLNLRVSISSSPKKEIIFLVVIHRSVHSFVYSFNKHLWSTFNKRLWASLVAQVKASASNAGDLGSIPGSGRSPGEGNSNPLQYSCLENPTDGEAWWATVHGVTKSRTRLSDLTFT